MKPRSELRMEADDGQRRLAVLIDADNAQASVIDGLLAEIAKYGIASVKRIYGDFTSQSHAQWKKSLLAHSISPVQQFAYTTGKNATDSALIIDAMDLMYTRRFDGFCLVSSDSDFTRLAQRLREEGLLVLGFGEKKTPASFVAACDKFVYTEVLRAETAASAALAAATPANMEAIKPSTFVAPAADASVDPVPTGPNQKSDVATAAKSAKKPVLPLDLILQAIDDAADESGWAHLGAVGAYLTKIRPDFDARLYGHKKLSDLVKSRPKDFVLESRTPSGGTNKIHYIRAAGRT